MNPCEMFGHNWVVKPVKGRLTEMCAACKAKPEEEAA